MIVLFAALSLLSVAVQSDSDRPVVILIYTNDTGWVHPLDTAQRTGDLWRGELIAIQSLSEDFTVVRSDVDVEIDCAQSRARMLNGRSYDRQGRLLSQEAEGGPDEWEAVNSDAWPVLQMLHTIACQPVDLTGQGEPLGQAEERVRTRINDY
ncbi:MAG: hypothetical protein Q8M32_14855 [Brevundimonas sp.]|uniref:hypothetical protein n=1 Tax=Brevundimonas sp. TaxID=1871086 RepID=UPI0027166B2C|nr:hypothetical protein [Brevundimonas sp.]MDO9586886.1 hypothetical protein [Brevundimonas sp.]MDP3371107.1 hypothetical protein [Brevundimonas sp.]